MLPAAACVHERRRYSAFAEIFTKKPYIIGGGAVFFFRIKQIILNVVGRTYESIDVQYYSNFIWRDVMKIIDVHCHVFSEDVLTFGGKLLIAFSDVITDLIDSGDYDHADNMIERINAFIEISGKDPSDIANALFDHYGDDSIIAPLMYDMYYLTHDQQHDIRDKVDQLMQDYDAHNHPEKDRADTLRASLASIGDKVKDDLVDEVLKDNSFEIQFQILKKLKNIETYRDRFYPFLSFDPRRSGNLDKIKANVGPGKDFCGVKLYAPLGFSAAHPAMMDKRKGLYAYCVANDIPVIAHCSSPGMPTMNDHLYVPHDSWVFDVRQGGLVALTMDKVVDFSLIDRDVKSQYFNHPEIWRIVLDEFPSLRLNLAHFGGDRKDWREIIANMIKSNKYQNLYTDISCHTDPDVLKYIRDEYDTSDAVKRRLMYGSDFTILLLFADLLDHRNVIETTFPLDQHQDVYCDNARRFLKLTPDKGA